MKESTIIKANELLENRNRMEKFYNSILRRNSSPTANKNQSPVRFQTTYSDSDMSAGRSMTFTSAEIPDELRNKAQQILEEAMTRIQDLAEYHYLSAKTDLKFYKEEEEL